MIIWLSCLPCWFPQEWPICQWDGLKSWLATGLLIIMSFFQMELYGAVCDRPQSASKLFNSTETAWSHSVNLVFEIQSLALFMVGKCAPCFRLTQTGKALNYCLVSDKSHTSSSGSCSTHRHVCVDTHHVWVTKKRGISIRFIAK